MKIQAAIAQEVLISPKDLLRAAARLVLAYQGLDVVNSRLTLVAGVKVVEVMDREAMRGKSFSKGQEIPWMTLRQATPDDEFAFAQYEAMMEMCHHDNVEQLARAQWIVEQRQGHDEWRTKMREATK